MCGARVGLVRAGAPAYGWPFPPRAERYALLEDALRLLPQMWGPGAQAVPRDGAPRPGHVVLPAAAAGARADPRRRLRRAAHAAPRRRARRRLQPVRRAGGRRPQGGGAPRALRRRRARPGRGLGHATSAPCSSATISSHVARARRAHPAAAHVDANAMLATSTPARSTSTSPESPGTRMPASITSSSASSTSPIPVRSSATDRSSPPRGRRGSWAHFQRVSLAESGPPRPPSPRRRDRRRALD